MSIKNLLLASFLFVFISANAQFGPKDKIVEPKYLFEKFTEGFVYLKNDTVISVRLNLNTLNQEMLFKKDTTTLKLDMPNRIDSVVINSRVFIPYGKMFYEFVIGKKLKLLVKNSTRWDTKDLAGYGYSKLAKTTTQSNFIQGGSIATLNSGVEVEYFDDSEFYISNDKALLDALKLKNYIELVPNMKDVIRAFVKDNKLKLSRKNDMFKLVIFINTTLKKKELRK